MEPMLRDKVLSAASVKTIDELEGPQGRENLKREIMNLINASIKDRMSGAVVDVYFNEFLIQ
jgi:flagellar basal body-associated protein FliL